MKVAREGFVQDSKSLAESRDKVFAGIAKSVIKTASVKTEEKKANVEEQNSNFKDKMTKKEAEACGFFKSAKACGWGIYQVSDLDGGAGSVWYLEKDADGLEYLVKQINSAGDVVRRTKNANQ